MRTPAAALSVALVVALVACTPTGPLESVDLIELDLAPVRVPEQPPTPPDDTGSIDFATEELLTDYMALTGESVDVNGLLEAEQLAGAQLRAAIAEQEPGSVPGASGASDTADAVTTASTTIGSGDDALLADDRTALVAVYPQSPTEAGGAGESLVVGMLTSGLLVPIMYDSWWVRDLPVGGSSGRIGSAETAGARSSGETEVRRTASNELSVAFQQQSTSKDGVTSTNRLTQEGRVCPGDDGEFDFTQKLDREVTGPSGDTVKQELTARVTGRLGEDGFPESMTIDAVQATREAPASGRAIYVETRQRLENASILNAILVMQEPAQLVRSSSGASGGDVRRIASGAASRLGSLAWGAVLGASTGMWTKGCVRVEASAPATVPPRSGVEIPVTVRARLSGEEFSSAVTATLSGSESVDPGSFRSTSAVTFVAGESGTSGAILFRAASRRGTAETTVTISTTGRAYFAEGQNDDVYVSGVICDLTREFQLSGTGVTMRFNPQNASGGTWDYRDDGTYGQGLIELSASGTYEVSLEASGAQGSIRAQGSGTTSVDTPLGRQSYTFPGDFRYTLTALEGTPDECAG